MAASSLAAARHRRPHALESHRHTRLRISYLFHPLCRGKRSGFCRDPAPGLDPRFVTSALTELIALWRPLGVDVVLFTGTPRPQPATAVTMVFTDRLPADRSTDTLGWIGFQDDTTAAPVIFVSITAVQCLVAPTTYKGLSFSSIPQARRDGLIARAVGRTAAHELGHFLLSSRSHTRTGLMRERFVPQELIEEYRSSFQLESPQRTILAARLLDGQFLTAASFALLPDR